uniref:Uncharacterized protein n=1 Tax=Arundo donax TaxID=35708 RepID=A0A0A8Y654_ARUDO
MLFLGQLETVSGRLETFSGFFSSNLS